MIFVLSVNDFEVFIFQSFPALDQEAVRVIVTSADITLFSGRNQAANNGATGTDDAFRGVAAEAIRITAQVDADAVYLQLLADVAGNDVGVVAAFGEVIICAVGRAVSQVKRFTKACLVGFIVWRQGKKKLVEGFDMIARFDGDIILAVRGDGIQHLAVEQDYDAALDGGNQCPALVNRKTHVYIGTEYHHYGKSADMLKCRFEVFKFLEHTI